MSTGPRSHILYEANYRQLLDDPPNVAVLPWGATEAHNYHLPHGTDVIEATAFAERAADLAVERGGKPIVLPTIPYGNDEQQLDQVATVPKTRHKECYISIWRPPQSYRPPKTGHTGNPPQEGRPFCETAGEPNPEAKRVL